MQGRKKEMKQTSLQAEEIDNGYTRGYMMVFAVGCSLLPKEMVIGNCLF